MADTMGIATSTEIPRKRKGSPKKSGDQRVNVYIWDMDETLILLKSLLNRTYAEAFNGLKDVQKGVQIGELWEKLILQVCDDYFFYEQIENCNTPYIDALSQYDDGLDLSNYDFNEDGFSPPCDDINNRKLAYRHRVIAEKYRKGLHNIFDQDMVKFWDDLYAATDSYTDGWFSSARACLEQCSHGSSSADSADGISEFPTQHINVLVTSGSLIPSLVKCLLFRLDDLLTHENGEEKGRTLCGEIHEELVSYFDNPNDIIDIAAVSRSWEAGKLKCFSFIKERFSGANARFCVIGDGWEECEAAQVLRWPFVKIDVQPDGTHRFPGLTPTTLNHYFSVIYGNADAKDNED